MPVSMSTRPDLVRTDADPVHCECGCQMELLEFYQVIDGKLRRTLACIGCGMFTVVPLPPGV